MQISDLGSKTVWFTDPLTKGSIRCSKQVQKDPRVRKWVQNSELNEFWKGCVNQMLHLFTDSSPELPNQPDYGQAMWQGTNQLVSLTHVIQGPRFHLSLGRTSKEGSKKNILVGIFGCWGAFLHCKETELEGNKNSQGADLFPFLKNSLPQVFARKGAGTVRVSRGYCFRLYLFSWGVLVNE